MIVDNVVATDGDVLVGINTNYGDTAKISNSCINGPDICDLFVSWSLSVCGSELTGSRKERRVGSHRRSGRGRMGHIVLRRILELLAKLAWDSWGGGDLECGRIGSAFEGVIGAINSIILERF